MTVKREMSIEEDNIGRWLSAAIEDPNVCEEMKSDIRQWFDLFSSRAGKVPSTKPSWQDAPKWANWLAMDSNGGWFWYASKPKVEHIPNPLAFLDSGDGEAMAVVSENWQQTLEQRPEEIPTQNQIELVKEYTEQGQLIRQFILEYTENGVVTKRYK